MNITLKSHANLPSSCRKGVLEQGLTLCSQLSSIGLNQFNRVSLELHLPTTQGSSFKGRATRLGFLTQGEPSSDMP